MPTERSKPLFPTYGPAYMPGKSWEAYYVEMRKENHPDPVDVDDDSDDLPESITVTIPATEIPEKWFKLGAPKALLTWRNRLLANDWEFKQGACQSWHEATYYKNGNLNSPAHFEELWWLNAIKDGKYITISYNLRDGAVYSARTSRTVRGMWGLLGDKELKAIVEGEDG